MISCESLSVLIGGKPILEDVSLTFRAGEVTAILGPNGAGKSTLLQCLTGSRKADAGRVEMGGRSLTDYSLKALAKRRAVLSQSASVSFPFTAREIVMMGRNPYFSGGSDAEDQRIAEAALETLDALHLADRRFPTLSGGEQQRVQFARVLSQIWEEDGTWLFLDEPTSALDLRHQYRLLELVREIAAKHHLGVVIVLHDLNLARQFTDRACFLKDGRLRAEGESREIINADMIAEMYSLPRHYALQHVGPSPAS